MQAVSTPAAPPHVALAKQLEHGAYPVADHDVPASHSALHTVFVVAVQSVSTFFAPPHVVTAAQLVHGVKPDTDHVEPTTHGAA